MTPTPASRARHLLRRTSFGVLSTHSSDVEGYPFGSVTPYAVDQDGLPILLISGLAQHTRNIQRDRRVSLTVFDPPGDDPQAGARLTWLGDALPVPPEDTQVRRRYQDYLPHAARHLAMPDFRLYRIEPRRARYIGGFGEIHWVEPDQMCIDNPLAGAHQEIVDHMNQDHLEALRTFCRALRGIESAGVRMVGIDHEGFDVLADGRLVRLEFDEPVLTPMGAREAFKRLLRSR